MARTSTIVTAVAAAVIGTGALATAGVAAVVLTTNVHGSAVLSGSMRPAFAPGDAVLIRNVPVSEVRPGMVVEVIPPGESVPFAHRVVSVSGDRSPPTITTKGDANPQRDSWTVTLSSASVPRVVGVVPHLGSFVNAPTQPRDRAFLIALLGVMTTLFGGRMLVAAFIQQPRVVTDASA